MTKSIVISGPPAVGKSTIARTLAGRYGMRCISGGDVLKEMARELGLEPSGEDWWDTAEGMKFLSVRESDYDFDRRMDRRLVDICEGGNVVITSYTLPWLTRTAVCIWLECSRDVSARRLQERDGVENSEAYRIAVARYSRNAALYRKLYGFEFGGDPDIFDIVVDTDGKEAEQVLDEVIARLDDMP